MTKGSESAAPMFSALRSSLPASNTFARCWNPSGNKATRKNKKEYVGIKFYFAKNIAEKYGITDKVKIKFACSKVNLYQWFLIINDDGYTVRADANGNSFSCFMSYPFKFIDNKKLQFISENNIKFYEDKNIVSFSVVDVFKDNELILNED